MTEAFFSHSDYLRFAALFKEKLGWIPAVGIILGSGLNPVADEVEVEASALYSEIPGFPVPMVAGHEGRILVGRINGFPILVFQGRPHYYEGYSMQEVVLPIRVFQVSGGKVLIVTNAAGGLNPYFKPGDLMLITDHINIPGLAGIHPLRGPNEETIGPRFLDMVNAYDPQLRSLAQKAAKKAGIELHEGIYVMLTGPSYETPAEIRFLRLIGADAVGMSTVPEVIAARHGGMRVLGISGISNVIPIQPGEKGPDHQEVLEAGKKMVPKLQALLRHLIPMIYETGV
ncbi:MAG: purine-nucleoside phosphorylase [Anaerolineae bacterium]|nr:purine-nucleoside phosphorylase [Anaerolineae bacterium]